MQNKHSDCDAALIIFVKNPVLGHVKTRIAKDIGDHRALEIYKKLMEHTRFVSEAVSINRFLFYSQEIRNDDLWSNEKYHKFLQVDTDLGGRMEHAFNHTLKEYRKAIIIGSDCIQIDSKVLREALNALDEHDTVIGPTFDGGYYLLGMKKPQPSLFQNIDWSTEVVFDQTMKKVEHLKLKAKVLKKLSDVDYYEDWVKYGKD